mgnify:CR=1 FL=1
MLLLQFKQACHLSISHSCVWTANWEKIKKQVHQRGWAFSSSFSHTIVKVVKILFVNIKSTLLLSLLDLLNTLDAMCVWQTDNVCLGNGDSCWCCRRRCCCCCHFILNDSEEKHLQRTSDRQCSVLVSFFHPSIYLFMPAETIFWVKMRKRKRTWMSKLFNYYARHFFFLFFFFCCRWWCCFFSQLTLNIAKRWCWWEEKYKQLPCNGEKASLSHLHTHLCTLLQNRFPTFVQLFFLSFFLSFLIINYMITIWNASTHTHTRKHPNSLLHFALGFEDIQPFSFSLFSFCCCLWEQ